MKIEYSDRLSHELHRLKIREHVVFPVHIDEAEYEQQLKHLEEPGQHHDWKPHHVHHPHMAPRFSQQDKEIRAQARCIAHELNRGHLKEQRLPKIIQPPPIKVDHSELQLHFWSLTVAQWIQVLLLLALLLVTCVKSFGQTASQIYTIKFQHSDNSDAASYASPFIFKEGLNVTFTKGGCPGADCGKMVVAASSTAATAWSAITAATNSNAGTFAMSGNSLDLTATTLTKLRVAGGLTTSVNGDIGYDSTAKNWHAWGNAVDTYIALLPVSITPANNDCVKWTVAAGVFTLNTAGAACGSGGGGYATIQNAGVAIAQETTLNWTAGIVCVDNAGATRSDCALANVTAVAHKFFNSVASGALVLAQPDYGDLTGTPQLAQTLANASHKWLNSYSAVTGLFTQTQPDYSDLTGVPSTFAPSAHNILSASHGDTTAASAVRGDGFFAIGATPTWQRLAHPSTSGGYFKWNGTDVVASSGAAGGTGTCSANQFETTDNGDAAPTCAQPAFTNLSGVLALGQTPLTTRGDLLTVNSVPALARLAVGGANTLLHGGLDASYSAVVQGDVTNGYVDLSTNQTIAGNKTLPGNTTITAGQNKIVDYNENNVCKVDGNKYARTDVGIQQAINDCAAQSTGGKVFLGPGTYSIAANINLASHVIVECSGWDTTQLIWTGGAGPNAIFFGNNVTDVGVTGCNFIGPNSGNATITHQSSANATTTGTPATSKAVTITTLVNTTVVVCVADASNAVSGVTDSGGSSYTRLNWVQAGTLNIACYGTAPGKALASTSVTVTTSTSENFSVAVVDYNNVQNYGITPITTQTSTNPTHLVPTSDTKNAITEIFAWQSGSAISASAQNGTIRQNTASTASNHGIVSVDTITTGAPSNVTDSVTLGSSAAWAGVAIELKSPTTTGASDVRASEIDGTTRHFLTYNKCVGMSYCFFEQNGGTDSEIGFNWLQQTTKSAIVAFNNYPWIHHNKLDTIGTSNLDHGIYFSGGDGALIEGNIISNVTGFGINSFTSVDSQNNEDTKIVNNDIVHAGTSNSGARGGIQVGFGGTAEYSRKVIVANNTISSIFGDRGIGIGDGRNFSLANNTVRDYGSGDCVYATSNISAANGGGIFGLTISNQTCDTNSQGGGPAILFDGANGGLTGFTVNGGYIKSPWSSGFNCNATTAAITNGVIQGLRIEDYNAGNISTDGITLQGAQGCSKISIYGTRISNSVATGYAVDVLGPASTDNQVYGNNLLNAAGAITDTGTRTQQWGNKVNTTTTAQLPLAASTTAGASLNTPSGTAPTTPQAGDRYSDGTNLTEYGLRFVPGISKSTQASIEIPGAMVIPTVAPVLTCSNTGGSLAAATHFFKYIFNNTTAGQTTVSPEASCATTGTTGSVVVTAPTLPTNATGYTVYDSNTTNTELQQAASPACVNITANCTVTTLAAGSAVPGANTASAAATTTSSTSGDIGMISADGTIANNIEQHATQINTPALLTGTTPPACTAGTAGFWCGAEGTAFTNVASTAGIYPDSTAHEYFAKTNGASTAGMLVRSQPGSINQTGKTALIATATLCAASAGACNVAGQYRVSWNFWGSGTACSSVTAGSVTFLLTWTDENAVAHSAVALQMMAQSGAATTANQASFPFQTALANESASGDVTISTNGSVIQYATGYTACTTGTGTYNLRATVMRIQ